MSAFDILKARSVTRLCHFTLLKSLTHIITSEEGVLASSSICQDTKTATDTARYDGELDYVCCSVQYPNSWFLQKAAKRNTDQIFNEWVVLYVDLSILNYRRAKFCPCNASKEGGRYINGNMEEIESIFAAKVPTYSYARTINMLDSCPTDGQAEILIQESIPRQFICGVAVGSGDIAGRVYAMLKLCGMNKIPIFIAPSVLTPNWSQMVRNGCRPDEASCNWPEED